MAQILLGIKKHTREGLVFICGFGDIVIFVSQCSFLFLFYLSVFVWIDHVLYGYSGMVHERSTLFIFSPFANEAKVLKYAFAQIMKRWCKLNWPLCIL